MLTKASWPGRKGEGLSKARLSTWRTASTSSPNMTPMNLSRWVFVSITRKMAKLRLSAAAEVQQSHSWEYRIHLSLPMKTASKARFWKSQPTICLISKLQISSGRQWKNNISQLVCIASMPCAPIQGPHPTILSPTQPWSPKALGVWEPVTKLRECPSTTTSS